MDCRQIWDPSPLGTSIFKIKMKWEKQKQGGIWTYTLDILGLSSISFPCPVPTLFYQGPWFRIQWDSTLFKAFTAPSSRDCFSSSARLLFPNDTTVANLLARISDLRQHQQPHIIKEKSYICKVLPQAQSLLPTRVHNGKKLSKGIVEKHVTGSGPLWRRPLSVVREKSCSEGQRLCLHQRAAVGRSTENKRCMGRPRPEQKPDKAPEDPRWEKT